MAKSEACENPTQVYFDNLSVFGVNIAIIMEKFTLNALKLPKIAQNEHVWYFQNSLTLPFLYSFDF